MNLYLTRSKKALLDVNYGWMTLPSVFEKHIIPECHRLQSLSIPLGGTSHEKVTQSLSESAKSLKSLDMWMVFEQFPIPVLTMERVSQFAPNITVLRLHDITTSLASLTFPALVKLTFRVTSLAIRNPDAADLVQFLRNSPIIEELDLRLTEGFKADTHDGTVALTRLNSAVFNGFFTPNNTIDVNVLPCLILPKQSVTVDVQVGTRALLSNASPFLSVIQLGSAVLSRQSITAATIHVKNIEYEFFGHISICGEHNNWIGLNHARVTSPGKGLLSRLHSWFNPLSLVPFHEIQTLTLGLFEFVSDEEQSVDVLRVFLQGLDQVRILNVYKMNVSLVARILQPSDETVPLPLLEELRVHRDDPAELTRFNAHNQGTLYVVLLKG